ncbi:hypothetical protein Pmi06nite_81480 [Planotetraspora mira]|uniref:Uncharacterized protein n=1 Tax=Planotetraspora mira TaxID=58121 RepID=A0A8J3TY74_9ACTN|nr:hypothetical protein Pmi06nite_81480 [Planotetraspora mira]
MAPLSGPDARHFRLSRMTDKQRPPERIRRALLDALGQKTTGVEYGRGPVVPQEEGDGGSA